MKNYVLCAAVAASGLIAVPAAAQTAASDGGARVELFAGYDNISVDLEDLGVDESVDDQGAVVGIGFGYDFPLGEAMLAGLDVEASESTIHEGDSTDGAVSVNRDLYVGGRLTFAAGGNVRLYVKGGYTNLRVKAELDGNSESASADGFRVGVGGQIPLKGEAYLGGEFRYSNYEADVSRNQVVMTLGTRF